MYIWKAGRTANPNTYCLRHRLFDGGCKITNRNHHNQLTDDAKLLSACDSLLATMHAQDIHRSAAQTDSFQTCATYWSLTTLAHNLAMQSVTLPVIVTFKYEDKMANHLSVMVQFISEHCEALPPSPLPAAPLRSHNQLIELQVWLSGVFCCGPDSLKLTARLSP